MCTLANINVCQDSKKANVSRQRQCLCTKGGQEGKETAESLLCIAHTLLGERGCHNTYCIRSLAFSPACSVLQLFSASFVLPAVAGVGAVETGSGLTVTFAGPAAPAG